MKNKVYKSHHKIHIIYTVRLFNNIHNIIIYNLNIYEHEYYEYISMLIIFINTCLATKHQYKVILLNIVWTGCVINKQSK